MPETEIKIIQYKCAKCKHTWIPRSNKKPKVCPICKRMDWDSKE